MRNTQKHRTNNKSEKQGEVDAESSMTGSEHKGLEAVHQSGGDRLSVTVNPV